MEKPCIYAVFGSLGDFSREVHKNMIAHWQMLLVSKDVHGRGIGRKLTMSTIERARINGFDSIELTVDKVNTKAEKLYRSAGYIDSELTHSNPEKKYMVHYFM